MAELDFESYDTGAMVPRSVHGTRMINLAGAACSIALIAGLGIWGYKLAVRDVNGVPVIRALAGPMREAPQTPGGVVASHQGLSVNAVAAVGTAASLPDQVLLAPAPVDLVAEDAAGLGIVVDPAVLPQAQVDSLAINPDTFAETAQTAQTTDTDAAVALALADALADGVEPFADLAAVAPSDPTALSALRPKPRPTQQTAAAAPADQSAGPAVIATAEIDPATLAVGTRLVQLGAFDTDAEARSEWARLQTNFGDLLAEKAIVVQAAQSGGRTFYRLRAHGFAGEDDARRLCAALVAENTPCIPTLHR